MVIKGINRYSGKPFSVCINTAVEEGCTLRGIGRGDIVDAQTVAEVLGRLIDVLGETGVLSAAQIVRIVGSDELRELNHVELVP